MIKIKTAMLLSSITAMGMGIITPALSVCAEEGTVYADSTIDQLKQQAAELKTEVDAAKAKVEAAQKQLDAAKAALTPTDESQGSLGFFRWLAEKEGTADAKAAVSVLEDTTGATQDGPKKGTNISAATHIGQDGDATSIANLKTAINMIEKSNTLRTTDNNFPNLQPLKISAYLMAVSEKHTNYNVEVHAHCQAYYVAENLAWSGFYDPYTMWYDWEKASYEANDGDVTGHYLNIVNSSYTVTGAAASRNGTYGQVFDLPYGTIYQDAMTVDQFRSKLETYLSSAGSSENNEEAKKAVEAAQKELDSAAEDYNAKQTALTHIEKQLAALENGTNPDMNNTLEWAPGMAVLVKPGETIFGLTNDTSHTVIIECDQDYYLSMTIVTGSTNVTGIPTVAELLAQLSGSTQKPSDTNTNDSAADTSGEWIKNGSHWTFVQNGKPLTGKQTLTWNGTSGDYYFDANGIMYCGWRQENGEWVRYTSSGEMKKNSWLKVGDDWYYATASGAMAKGWVQDKTGWYYLEPTGTASTTQCAMKTGWHNENGFDYFLDNSGKAAEGWKTISGKSYYFYTTPTNGSPARSLAKNTYIDQYYVDANGVWVA